jgi:hypothetical protein
MELVEPSFDHSSYTRNRERLLRANVSRQFFDKVVVQADRPHLLSDEHFTMDGHADRSRGQPEELPSQG